MIGKRIVNDVQKGSYLKFPPSRSEMLCAVKNLAVMGLLQGQPYSCIN